MTTMLRMKKLIFALLAPLFVLGVLFWAPNEAHACHRTFINFPAEGENLNLTLPTTIIPKYDTLLNPVLLSSYYLDIYKGVPQNAEILNGHSQGRFECGDNVGAVDADLFTTPGDYFYVLYRDDQVEQMMGPCRLARLLGDGRALRSIARKCRAPCFQIFRKPGASPT